MDLQARVASCAILSRRAKAAYMRASDHGVAPSLRIWPITTKKRGSRERSSPPCQIRTLILPRAERRAAILFLTSTQTQKFFELSGHAGVSLTDHVCAPSNGFPAVYDSIGPPSAFHDPSIAVPVGSPSSDAFGSNSGRVRRPETTAGHQPQSFGRRPNGGRALQESRVIGRLKLLRNFDAHNPVSKEALREGNPRPSSPPREHASPVDL